MGLAIILTYLLLSVVGPFVVGHDPLEQNLSQALQGASWDHPLGTDELGRDILSRILNGGRLTLLIVMCSVSASALVGSLLGLLSGYAGSVVDLEAMGQAGLIGQLKDGVKILADGELTKALTVKAHKFSKSAQAKIEAAGGTIEVL